jgi:hypothetical protein
LSARLVIPTSSHVPESALERAIHHALAAGGSVRVALPIVLPPTLPIGATPPRLLGGDDAQCRAARRVLVRAGRPPLVETVQCRSVAAMVKALCADRPPTEIVVAGSAPWLLRRSLHGLAPVTIIPGRVRGQAPATAPGPLVSEA